MLTLPAGIRVFAYDRPTDLRRSFDRLTEMVRQILKQDPLGGHLFLFRNRAGDRVKILWHEPTGFWLFYKRLHRGTFPLPRAPGQAIEIDATDLATLLQGICPQNAKRA
jgi:transposase